MKAMFQKLHTEQGMSLGEALATTLIMSFVMIGIATGVTAGVRVYHQITERAEAQTLLATNIAALSEYLEKGHDITTTADTISIGYSEVSGTKVLIQNKAEGKDSGIYVQYYDSDGEADGSMEPLISTKSNTSGLYALISGIEEEGAASGNIQSADNDALESDLVTTYTITVYNKNGTKTNESENVSVRNTVQYGEDDPDEDDTQMKPLVSPEPVKG